MLRWRSLAVSNLHRRFGGLHVLKGVSFEVNSPELIGQIGPNGAGETTLTNVLVGAIKPNSGTVYLIGNRIDLLEPYQVAAAGLGRTFQVSRAFRRMTVLENLYVPALAKHASATKAQVHDQEIRQALKIADYVYVLETSTKGASLSLPILRKRSGLVKPSRVIHPPLNNS